MKKNLALAMFSSLLIAFFVACSAETEVVEVEKQVGQRHQCRRGRRSARFRRRDLELRQPQSHASRAPRTA